MSWADEALRSADELWDAVMGIYPGDPTMPTRLFKSVQVAAHPSFDLDNVLGKDNAIVATWVATIVEGMLDTHQQPTREEIKQEMEMVMQGVAIGYALRMLDEREEQV